MNEVYVNSSAINGLIKKCDSARSELAAAISKCKSCIALAGSQWNDEKAKEFTKIITDCGNSLKKPMTELQRCEQYLQKIGRTIAEYEDISFGNSNRNESNSSDSMNNSGDALGPDVGLNFFRILSNGNNDIPRSLAGVEHIPITPASSERTEQQIISSISGGDMTEGSCSSLALAYAGNRAGYIVFDFRDGRSREVFSSRSTIEQIANMEGVSSVILRGTDDSICAEQLMSNMERGREYYMATGEHAAIVRLNDEGHYQYLELQSGNPEENGWQPLTQYALFNRFRCRDNSIENSNYLIELSSLQNNTDFLNLLGYINTDESQQMRGACGYAR